MKNFNPEEYENTINPYTLPKAKQQKVIDVVDDERLTNPPGDYFRLKLQDGTIDIPKLELIGKKTTEGKITRLPVQDYIRDLLNKNY